MGDVPHEGHQLTGNGNYDNIFVFAARDKFPITGAQSHLSLPGDLA